MDMERMLAGTSTYDIIWGDDTQTYVVCTLGPRWAWRDLDNMIIQSIDMLSDSARHPGCILIDMSETRFPPYNPLHSAVRFARDWPDALDCIVFVEVPIAFQAFRPIMDQLYPHLRERVIFKQTLDEAHLFIRERLGI